MLMRARHYGVHPTLVDAVHFAPRVEITDAKSTVGQVAA